MLTRSKRRDFKKNPVRKSERFATKSFVKKAIAKASESKFFDTLVDITSVITTHTPVNLCLVASGVDDDDRIGDHIHLDSVHIKLMAQAHLTTPLAAHCKLLVFRWFDSTTPGSASILLSSGSVTVPISQNNVTTNSGKYQILWTRNFNIVPTAANDHIMIEKFIKLKGSANWSSASATAITNSGGQVFFQVVSDLAANGPDLHMNCRFRFHD